MSRTSGACCRITANVGLSSLSMKKLITMLEADSVQLSATPDFVHYEKVSGRSLSSLCFK